jgi:hypothetical protein
MRSLLPYLFLLACPVMMIFMMRGMRGDGHGSSETGHDTHTSDEKAGTPAGQVSEKRIAQLEREVAAPRRAVRRVRLGHLPEVLDPADYAQNPVN